MRCRDSFFLWTGLAFVVGVIAVSGQSLWIDEAQAAVKAMEPTWGAFLARMRSESGSDAQMPLYMAMLWVWEKIFGSSEWVLRAMNLPLWVMSIAVFCRKGPGSMVFRNFWISFALCSPFLWVYLDEARPYILQFAASTLILSNGSTFGSGEKIRGSGYGWFCAGIWLLCASSLTGVVFAFYFGLAGLCCLLRKAGEIDVREKFQIVAFTVVLGMLLSAPGFYYLQTLLRGAAPSSVGKTSVQTLLFSGYEFLGFPGLGPSRSQLRTDPLSALLSHIWILAGFACVWGLFLRAAVSEWIKRPEKVISKPVVIWFSAGMAGALSLTLAGHFREFRVLGRHYMPLMPFVLCLFAWAAEKLWNNKRAFLPVLLLGAFLLSSLAYRFAERHAKDDYKSVSELVSLNRISPVWWAGDAAAAEYYGVKDAVILLFSPGAEDLAGLPDPEMIILSKPDIYDPHGLVEEAAVSRLSGDPRVYPGIRVWSAVAL